jgi:hypothetical protein
LASKIQAAKKNAENNNQKQDETKTKHPRMWAAARQQQYQQYEQKETEESSTEETTSHWYRCNANASSTERNHDKMEGTNSNPNQYHEVCRSGNY